MFKNLQFYLKCIFSDWWGRISGTLSVPFTCLALIVQGDPKTMFIVLAFLSLLITCWRLAKTILDLENRFKSKLKIACSPEIDGCIKTANWGSGLNTVYRIVVESTGVEPIPNCQGQLRSITKEGEAKPRWSGDTAILTFAPGENSDALAKTIHHNTPVHLDVVFIENLPREVYQSGPSTRLLPGTKTRQWLFNPPFHQIFSEYGNYILGVKIIAPSFPTLDASLRFKWTGAHESSELHLI